MKYFLASLLALAALPVTPPPSTNFSIDFTNKGEGSAYIHWLLPPGLTTSASSVNFGTVPVGSSTVLGLTLLNDGGTQIQFQPFLITGVNAADFTFVSHCAEFLDVSASCQINITFKPSAIGTRTATLTIPFAGMGVNAPTSMQIVITKLLPPTDLNGKVKTQTQQREPPPVAPHWEHPPPQGICPIDGSGPCPTAPHA